MSENLSEILGNIRTKQKIEGEVSSNTNNNKKCENIYYAKYLHEYRREDERKAKVFFSVLCLYKINILTSVVFSGSSLVFFLHLKLSCQGKPLHHL